MELVYMELLLQLFYIQLDKNMSSNQTHLLAPSNECGLVPSLTVYIFKKNLICVLIKSNQMKRVRRNLWGQITALTPQYLPSTNRLSINILIGKNKKCAL